MRTLDFRTMILLEDDDCILVNKPPMIATLADRAQDINMLQLARTYCQTAQVCHRLDKETSGVLAFAKHPEAFRYLTTCFEQRAVTKVYHAVVQGTTEYDHAEVSLPLIRRGDGDMVVHEKEGRDAVTFLQTLETFRGYALVECRPVTGRTHQIRVHLRAMGTPIAGDTRYGGQPVYLSALKRNYTIGKGQSELPLIRRFALHALSLEFTSPAGKDIRAEAPYPKDFRVLLRQLPK